MKRSALKLSVIVPVYNEEGTVLSVLERLWASPVITEIVVVNDGSTDKTRRHLIHFARKNRSTARRRLKLVHTPNQGKGGAIATGLKHVTGTHTLIQDADLEYDPADIPLLLEPIHRGRTEVIFGSRFLGPHSNLLFWHRKGNDFLNFIVNILYNTTLSDMECCHKLMPTKLWHELNLQAKKFDIEPEITCKLLKRGVYIYEVPISYVGRDFDQGKKITWKDGIQALWTVVKLRFAQI